MRSPAASLDLFAADKLAQLDRKQLRRAPVETRSLDAVRVERDGSELVNFCSNDYLGLARHPRVEAAARAAIADYGTGAAASRLVTGGHPLLFELERRLAAFKGSEDCLVFGSGYLANLAITPALAGRDDIVFIDQLAHACLHAAARLSGARIEVFRHNDLADLEHRLLAHRDGARHALILTDGVFSMDGDIAPLPDLLALADAHDAWTLVDDAHGVGVLAEGRGSAEAFERSARAPLQMGTLSKALGSYGGYLCASHRVCELLRSRARPLVFTTALPPASAAAALASLDIIETTPDLTRRPIELARRLARHLDLPEPVSPILPVIFGDAATTLRASQQLAKAGYLVTAIRPPTVPTGTARLRITLSAAHSEDQVDGLADALLPLLNSRESAA
ncbi:8-amino-7-oxononanoate synthase [Maricaulis sp. CAU 1757]